MSSVAQTAEQSNEVMRDKGMNPPKQGEHYRCSKCGMEIAVIHGCTCHDNSVHFRCCNQQMQRV